MSTFAPSFESAQAGVGLPMVRHELPADRADTVKVSLDAIARRVRDGREDPRVRGWAGRALLAAGNPKGAAEQAQALLDALKAQTVYAPDPPGVEMVVPAKTTLCLDEGLCMPAGDCDDLTVALASATLAIGLPTRIVGQSFADKTAPTHVLLEVEAPKGWLKIDPSSRTFRVGQSHPAVKEWRVDPLRDETLRVERGLSGGVFIGVGQATMIASIVQRITFVRDSLVRSTRELQAQLGAQDALGTNNDEALRKSDTALLALGMGAIDVCNSALARAREVFLDPESGDVVITSVDNDGWTMAEVERRGRDMAFAIYDSAKQLLMTIGEKAGQLFASAPTSATGVQAPPLVVAAGVGLFFIAGFWLYVRMIDARVQTLRAENERAYAECVASGKCSPEVLKYAKDLTNSGKPAKSELQSTLDSASGLIKWLVIGGVTVFAIRTFGPMLSDAARKSAQVGR